jgi:hypothetical protein
MNKTTQQPIKHTANEAHAFFKQGAAAGKLGFITSREIALTTVLNEFIDQLQYVSHTDYIQFKDDSLIIFKQGVCSIVKDANFNLDFYTQVQSKLA